MNEKKKCTCGGTMQFSHTVDLKTGGIADSELLLGLPKINQGILSLNIYVCEACGQVRFFAPKEIKDSLLHVASARVQDP